MELALNLFWLLLTVLSFSFWGRRGSTRRRSRSRLPVLGAIALGSALALLFPVISVTDDLHFEQAVLEDSSPYKRTFRQAGQPNAGAGVRTSLSTSAAAGFVPPVLAVLSILGFADPGNSRCPDILARPTRAPPAFIR